jgi:hypothetical protein
MMQAVVVVVGDTGQMVAMLPPMYDNTIGTPPLPASANAAGPPVPAYLLG